MKLKNIISIVSFLFIVVACSMEEDTMMNDINKEVQESSKAVATFNISFSTPAQAGVQTRSSSISSGESVLGTENEYSVRNCYVAVFDAVAGNLLASCWNGKDEMGTGSISDKLVTYSLNKTITIKVPEKETDRPKLRFVAVAQINPNEGQYAEMSSLEDLQNCTTYDDLMNCPLQEQPTVLVKVGEVIMSDYNATTSVVNNISSKVEIPVYQRSAAVELTSFEVENGNDVSVVGLQLINVALTAKVKGAITDDIENPYPMYGRDTRFYAYENPATNSTKTKLVIIYKTGGVEYERTYTIKTPANNNLGYVESVEAGKLYKLHVKITHVSEDVIFEIVDWIPNTIDLGEINGSKN